MKGDFIALILRSRKFEQTMAWRNLLNDCAPAGSISNVYTQLSLVQISRRTWLVLPFLCMRPVCVIGAAAATPLPIYQVKVCRRKKKADISMRGAESEIVIGGQDGNTIS